MREKTPSLGLNTLESVETKPQIKDLLNQTANQRFVIQLESQYSKGIYTHAGSIEEHQTKSH